MKRESETITEEDDISDADLPLVPILNAVMIDATARPNEPVRRVILRGLRRARALGPARRTGQARGEEGRSPDRDANKCGVRS